MQISFDFDKVFPNAGGKKRLQDTAMRYLRAPREVEGTTFTQSQLDHLRSIFDLLIDDEPARSTLATLICVTDSMRRKKEMRMDSL